MHTTIAAGIAEIDRSKSVPLLCNSRKHGLTKRVLDETDVLVWWGHAAHRKVRDAVVERILARCGKAWGSSRCTRLITPSPSCASWARAARSSGAKRRARALWVCNPAHPITRGIDRYFESRMSRCMGEPFAVPAPDEIIFISWFEGGEVFRSGCTWKRGNGKIFYFRPGMKFTRSIIIRVSASCYGTLSTGRRRRREMDDRCPQISPKNAPEPLEVKAPDFTAKAKPDFAESSPRVKLLRHDQNEKKNS